MAEEKKIVEVSVKDDGGERVPVGIMNANQALSLPEQMDVSVSHPDRKAGATDEFIDRDELRTLTEPWIEPIGIRFPAPISGDIVDRFEEATAAARNVFEEIIASANEAGWATQEITVALINAARSLEEVNEADILRSQNVGDRSRVGRPFHRISPPRFRRRGPSHDRA